METVFIGLRTIPQRPDSFGDRFAGRRLESKPRGGSLDACAEGTPTARLPTKGRWLLGANDLDGGKRARGKPEAHRVRQAVVDAGRDSDRSPVRPSAIRAERARRGKTRGNQADPVDGEQSSSEPSIPPVGTAKVTRGQTKSPRTERKVRWAGGSTDGHAKGRAVATTNQVMGEKMPVPAATGANVLVAGDPVIASPFERLAEPSVHSGSSGEEHEALEQPP